MPNLTEFHDVICPFFVSRDRLSVTCEGVIHGTTCRNRFKNAARLEHHAAVFCETFDFHSCPHAAAVEKKY